MVNILQVQRWMNIPADMRQRRQWAVSTLSPHPETGKLDKSPRHPATGNRVSVTNPLDWVSFDEAAGAGYPAIGFMLTAADPFTIIDLDDKPDTPEEAKVRHVKVFNAFPSYSERSQSGKGVHIVLYGKIGGGLNRDHIEVYDQDRYIVCTGDTVTNGAVQSHPDTLTAMVTEMGGVHSTKSLPESEAATCDDDTLIRRMESAANGERFKKLFYGPIPMGSENDAALISLLVFWTKNHDQALRIFARSVLYRPRGEADGKKGHSAATYHNKYLVDTLYNALAKQAEWQAAKAADIDHGRTLVEGLLAQNAKDKKVKSSPVANDVVVDFPPGLVGEVARYIYESAPRRVKEVAIAGALAFMAGICGRQFNVSSGVGLNLYIIMLAESGMGKEAAKNGADRLFHALTLTCPGVVSFLGPRAVSGPALEKAVAEHNPTFVTFMGEIGVRLQAMLAKRNGDPQMKAAWLGLYTAAVRNGRHQGAFHSNKENRTSDVIFPCVTIYGESTPSEYYKAISGSNFDDGFVPRFLTISTRETVIQRLNPNRALPPPQILLDRLATLVSYAIELQQRDQYLEVRFPEPDTAEQLDAHYMAIANPLPGGPIRTSWTRAPMQMFKVAALLAVGRNHLDPKINQEDLLWARQLVEASIGEITHREEKGELSGMETRKVPAIEEAVKAYFDMPDSTKEKTYKTPLSLIGKPLIPYGFFRRRLSQLTVFQEDQRGMANAIKAALQDAIDLNLLQRLTDDQKQIECGRKLSTDVYCLGPSWG